MKYKIITEVTEAKYCTAGIKTGQKYVFQVLAAILMVDESDTPPSARALAPIGDRMGGV